jgi:hypothetical protein
MPEMSDIHSDQISSEEEVRFEMPSMQPEGADMVAVTQTVCLG